VASIADSPASAGAECRPSPTGAGAGAFLLKHGDVFASFDARGDIAPLPGQGLYRRDTRYLSLLRLRIQGESPEVLRTGSSIDNGSFSADLSNPPLTCADGTQLPPQQLHLRRLRFIWSGTLFDRLAIRHCGQQSLALTLTVDFDADFADIFEARGVRRERRGDLAIEQEDADRLRIRYSGGDDRSRATVLRFSPSPQQLSQRSARWDLLLAPGQQILIFIFVDCETQRIPAGRHLPFHRGFLALGRHLRDARRQCAEVHSSDPITFAGFARARSDLTMLSAGDGEDSYPFAGLPWFSTVFGRDGLVTALLTLWADPQLARGVLRYLAAHQADMHDSVTESEPGKILHERREGELARLGIVPFRRYYGTVDATPLFVMLAGAYWRRTADRNTLDAIDGAVQRAMAWIRESGDRDGDGFVEYARRHAAGLANQGWKDSDDAIYHADGRLAEGPIALVEVQGYVYGAYRAAAQLADAQNRTRQAAAWRREAEALRRRVEAAFWDEAMGFYALALDGDKRPCRVRSSNAGHLLFCGLPGAERAARVARSLMSPAFFSGYGLRTTASGEPRYNPMAYHNGSVWPHDTALVALGLARYGYQAEAGRLLRALRDAASHMERYRLPELFCGFPRHRGWGPVAWPVACSPQAWAAAAPFGLLQAALGLDIDARRRRIRLLRPALPDGLGELTLRDIPLGQARASLLVRRRGERTVAELIDRQGELRLEVHSE
jgi:glycogen debranching enzyme